MISARHLHKWFGELHVLNDVSLEVARGAVVVIAGPSGSGKSTLIRTINRLEGVQSGDILVDGASVTGPKVDVNRLRQDIGMVFQQFNLFPHLTALENISLAPRKVKRMGRADAEGIAMGLLERVGIPEKAHHYPTQLSGGQQQRVAIARALAMQPKVMLFDEPTSALDPEMIKEVLDVMVDLARDSRTTMLVVTHEMGFARKVASEIAFMDQGTIVETAPPDEFFSNPREERSRAFLSKILSH
jgi:ABC-type polar amino acid transport system ATPase subunit